MAARALIFDLDGTIWDSAGWFAAALAIDPDTAASVRSDLIAGGNVIRLMNAARLSREKLIRLALERAGPPPLFGGIGDSLATLSNRGVPLGIATSLPGSLAMPMLEACGLNEMFGAVVHAGLCRAAKPNPTSIRMALALMGQQASPGVFYVGDRAIDRAAAVNAQVSFAWVRHGYEKPPEGAGINLHDAAELLEL